MNEKQIIITLKDIATATGQNVQVVRKHVRDGLDLGDVISLSQYVAGKRLLSGMVSFKATPLPSERLPVHQADLASLHSPTATTPSHRLPPQPDVKIKSKPLAIEGAVNDDMAAMLAAIGPTPETLSEINPELQQAIEVDEFIGLEKMRSEGTEMTVEELARWRELKGTAVEKRALRKMAR